MKEKYFISGNFYENAEALRENNFPTWGMSIKEAGSMRFRWNEVNKNRAGFLRYLSGDSLSEWSPLNSENSAASNEKKEFKDIAAVELVHSHTVFAVNSIEELNEKQGDGIITKNRSLIPVVTVADCMPIFLFEKKSGVFGVLHSGWKGTGIVKDAIEKAEKVYGAKRENFCVVMGPHIHDCCYTVDEERASYFRVNFGSDCVTPLQNDILGRTGQGERLREKRFSLSLAKANLNILREMGVHENNIVVCRDCTCCNSMFGSFRRETFGLPSDMSLEEKQKHFTVQAAWVKW